MLRKSFNSTILAIFMALASVQSQSVDQRCVLPLPRLAFFAPLIFSPNGTLISTENVSELYQDITIPSGNKVTLSCAPGYFKKYPNEKVLEATCKNDKILEINGEEKNFLKDLACELRSVEEILKSVEGCPSEMESVEYGYVNPIKAKSYVLGEACYSTSKGRTIFAHTKIQPSDTLRVQLKTGDENYFKQKHPTSAYKLDLLMASRLDELNERLQQYLGTKDIPFLETQHLFDQDLLINKQFQSILKFGWNYITLNGYEHMPNLHSLHDDILSLSGHTLDIYTGTHGVLSLKDSFGGNVDIYLTEGRFPVPKFIWVLVKSQNRIAAFAILNNPNATETDAQKENFCSTKCEQIGWIKSLLNNNAYKDPEKGYVVCCDYDEFRQRVTEMPQLQGQFNLLTDSQSDESPLPDAEFELLSKYT